MVFDIKSLAFFIALIGFAWAAFLALHRKGNRSANRYLAMLLGVLTLFILRRSASINEEGVLLYVYFVSHSLVFLIGPSIYLHIGSLTRQVPKNLIWHFIPCMTMVVLTSILYFIRQDLAAIQDTRTLEAGALTIIGFEVLHVITYLLLSHRSVRRYQEQCQSFYSTTPKINLSWVKGLLWLTTVLGMGIMLLSLLIITGGYYIINNTADTLFLVLLAIIIASLVIKSWSHPEIIHGAFDHEEKYKHSPLSGMDVDPLKGALERVLEQEIFLNPELTLQELARAVETRPYLLSQLLNEHYGQNFFSFINSRRIDFAKMKIREGFLENQTIEALAYVSGFNSKSTFNRAFRKQEDQSPRQYLELRPSMDQAT